MEQAVYFGLGFFCCTLIALVTGHAVWRRAVRLTTRRVQAGLPVSLTEIRADRDRLRAEFAMSARRLEVAVDALKDRTAEQLADIGRKNEQIRVLLAEVERRTAEVKARQDAEQGLRSAIVASEAAIGDAHRRISALEADLAAAARERAADQVRLAEQAASADARRVEIAALDTTRMRLENELADAQRALERAEAERVDRQARLTQAEIALAQARAEAAALASEVEAASAAARAQAEDVGRLRTRLAEQAGEVQGRVVETERMAERIAALTAERDRAVEGLARRTAEAEIQTRAMLDELQAFRADKAELEGRVAAERAERERLSAELKRIERIAKDNWDREQVENGLLREKMNDLAAEIAVLSGALTPEPGEEASALPGQSTGRRPVPAALGERPALATARRPRTRLSSEIGAQSR